jgi:hypothetical protein
LAWTDRLWRIADQDSLSFRTYPSPRYRFDAPGGEFPALYTCALDLGVFAEAYVERGRRLGKNEARRHLLELRPRQPLALIDLHSDHVLAAFNLDERISIGDDYVTCQAWALAIYQQYPDVSGIRYRARKAGALVANVLLYADRAVGSLEIASAPRLDEIEEVVLRAADRYRLTVFFSFKPLRR